ncbi:MAG: nitrile hydratase subunit alpha [Kiloniellales bacterium]
MAQDHSHHHGEHSHDHGPRAFQPDHPEPRTHYQFLGLALRELLIEKGVYSAEEERRKVEQLEAITPALGARAVARAWRDPGFKQRLLADGKAALAELGIDSVAPMIALENDDKVHNVVVCTLCSCYPRMVLGRQPAWYKSHNYRSRMVREPRRVLAEFGLALSDAVELRVHDSTAEMRYLVVPQRPAGTEGWTEEKLARLVTRDSMIGVARASDPTSLA